MKFLIPKAAVRRGTAPLYGLNFVSVAVLSGLRECVARKVWEVLGPMTSGAGEVASAWALRCSRSLEPSGDTQWRDGICAGTYA